MLSPSVRIFVCTAPVDMRRSFDGLAVIAKEVLGQDPQGGAVFVFLNKGRNRLKALWWDTTGYCLLSKRLHRAIFDVPRGPSGGVSLRIDGPALAALLAGRPLPEKKPHLPC